MINRMLENDMFLKNNSMFHNLLEYISKRCTVRIDSSIYELIEIYTCTKRTYIVEFDCGIFTNITILETNLSNAIIKYFGNEILETCDYFELKSY